MDNMSFTWFADFRDLLEDLSGSEEDAMILAVVKYGMYGDLPEFTGTTMALFKSFAKDVDYSKKKRGNGGRGGRPKTSKPNSENQSENLPENQGANVVKTTENQPENLLENPEQNSTEQNSVKQNTPPPYPPRGRREGVSKNPLCKRWRTTSPRWDTASLPRSSSRSTGRRGGGSANSRWSTGEAPATRGR